MNKNIKRELFIFDAKDKKIFLYERCTFCAVNFILIRRERVFQLNCGHIIHSNCFDDFCNNKEKTLCCYCEENLKIERDFRTAESVIK